MPRGTSSARSNSGEGEPSGTVLGLYKEAFEEGKRAVDDQIAELDSMRQRSVQFMAFVGSATGFLVGSGLTATTALSNRGVPFYLSAGIASAVSVAAIIGLLSVLLTFARNRGKSRDLRAHWNFRNSPEILVTEWIDADVGAPTAEDFYKELAIAYERKLNINDPLLRQVRRSYTWFLSLGGLQVIAWAAVIWIFA